MHDATDRIAVEVERGSTALDAVRCIGIFLLAYSAMLQGLIVYFKVFIDAPGWPNSYTRLFLAGCIVVGVGLVGHCRWAVAALAAAPVIGILSLFALLVAAGEPRLMLMGGLMLLPVGASLAWLARRLPTLWRGCSWAGRYRS